MDQLARLTAIEEIRQAKARHLRFMDTRDWDALGSVFCAEAVLDLSEGFGVVPVGGTFRGGVGPVLQGREAIVAYLARELAQHTCVHHGHCHEVTVESETEASGILSLQDHIRMLDRRTELVHAAGYYHERYRLEAGAWRIAHSKLTRLYSDRTRPPATAAPA